MTMNEILHIYLKMGLGKKGSLYRYNLFSGIDNALSIDFNIYLGAHAYFPQIYSIASHIYQ